uniref:Uncharacterized protein n=1 Tax=Desertifilum tharense IPPAS B-1220 TaxID=1781255 RepID=A0ACD5GUN3_9CYAN
MKSALSTLIASSLLATSVLIASSAPASADSLTIDLTDRTNTNIANYPTVKLVLDDTSNPGKITATVTVVPDQPDTSAICGVYSSIFRALAV